MLNRSFATDFSRKIYLRKSKLAPKSWNVMGFFASFKAEIRQSQDWHFQGFDCMSQFPLFVVANTSHTYCGFVIANQSHANQKLLIAK